MGDARAAQARQSAPRQAAFAALAVPNYRNYWLGLMLYVISMRADYITFAWITWELTHEPLYLGYLGLAQGVPTMLFQLFGGVMADRMERLRIIVGAQWGAALTLFVALVLTATGLMRIEALLLLAVLSNIFRAFDEPSRMALIPLLVDRDRLRNAIALGSTPWPAGRIVGSSLAGVIIAAFGGAAGFALAVLASFGTLALYSRIRLPAALTAPSSASVLQHMAEGFRFIARDSVFASLVLLSAFNSVFGMSYMALLPIYADQYLHAGSTGYGFMQAISGVGAVLGSITLASFSNRLRHRGVFLLTGATLFGLSLAVFSQSPNFAVALVMMALIGASSTLYLTTVQTIAQERAPDALRGRVMSIYALCWNLIPIGGMLGGALAHAVDARFAVLVGGSMVAANALLLLLSNKRLRGLS